MRGCLIYTILHQSLVIQVNSAGVLFNGLLAELSTILDSFLICTTRNGLLGVVGSHKMAGKIHAV